MIRFCTTDDKEWVLNIAEKAYLGTIHGWNRENAAKSYDIVINKKNSLLIRGEKTFLYASLITSLCDYTKKTAHMILLVGQGGSGLEPYRLLEAAKKWQLENKAYRFNISSITKHQFGTRMMKKLGATPSIVYDIEN